LPAKPSWYPNLSSIIEQVRQLQSPVIDRATIETLFAVRRRRANQLIARMGGYEIGRTALVEREKFLAGLEAIAAGADFHYEERRRVKVREKLDEARRIVRAQSVRIPVEPVVPPSPTVTLPEGVQVHRGEIRIAFDTPETLLKRLFELSQAMAHDFDEFSRYISGV
jgi:hypothetical protein